jgi:hypothetical protein
MQARGKSEKAGEGESNCEPKPLAQITAAPKPTREIKAREGA